MPQPQNNIPQGIQEEMWNHRRAIHLPNVGKKSEQKLTQQQIADFLRVGKITQEEADRLLAEYNKI